MIRLIKKENVIIAKINLSTKIVNQAKFKAQQLADKKRNKNIKLKEEQKKHYLDIILLYKGLTQLFLYLNNDRILLENMIAVINSFKLDLDSEVPTIEIEYYSGKKIGNINTKLSKQLFLKYLEKVIHLKIEDEEELKEIIEEKLNSSEDFLVLSEAILTPALIELNNLSYSQEYIDKLYKIYIEIFSPHKLPMDTNEKEVSLILDHLQGGLLYKNYLWLIITQLDNYHFPIYEKDIATIDEYLFADVSSSTQLNIFNTFAYFVDALKEIKCYRQINTFFEESIPNEFLPNLQEYEQYGENAWWYQINDKMDRSRNRGTGFSDQMKDGMALWYKSKYGENLPEFENFKSFEAMYAQYMNDWNKVAMERQKNILASDNFIKADIEKLEQRFDLEYVPELIEQNGVDAFNKKYGVNLPSDILNYFWKKSDIDQALKTIKSKYPTFLKKYFTFIAKLFEFGKKVEYNYSLTHFIKWYDEISKKYVIKKAIEETLNELILGRILRNLLKVPKLFAVAYDYKNVFNNIIQELFEAVDNHIKDYFYANVYFKKIINEYIKIFSVFNEQISADRIYHRLVNLRIYSNIRLHVTNAKKKNARLVIIPKEFKELFKKLEAKTEKFATLNNVSFASIGPIFPTYDKEFNERYFFINITFRKVKNDDMIFLLDEEFYNEVITYVPEKWTSFFESIKNIDSNYDKFINLLATNNEKDAFYNYKNLKFSESTLENYKKFVLALKKYN